MGYDALLGVQIDSYTKLLVLIISPLKLVLIVTLAYLNNYSMHYQYSASCTLHILVTRKGEVN